VSETRVFPWACKSALTKSKISSLDYALNPYVGCEHGCAYCYATFMSRFTGIEGEWGSFVGVKERAPEVLARELERRRPGVVCLGTVCDAYQPVERKTSLSRACLEAFVGVEGFEVGILTKSDLVARDRDVLRRLESPDVGFTITCLDASLARLVEPKAPPPAKRLEAMRELKAAGIPVWGFLGPILPALSDSEEAIAEVLREMDRAGASHVLVDRMNLYPGVWRRFRELVSRSFPERMGALTAVRRAPGEYEAALSERVESAARSVGVEADVCF
jgi:DNA repair photolyase